ncbi:MAG TPA: PQQ-dependent sugar dehydrogenase, partial [Polyangiaceae bacterium]
MRSNLWRRQDWGGLVVAIGFAGAAACGTDEPVVSVSGTNGGAGAEAAATNSATAGAAGSSGSEAGAAHGGAAGGSEGGSSTGGATTTATTSSSTGSASPGVVDVTLSFESIRLSGANRAVDFRFVPGHDDELLVLGHAGFLYHYRLEGRNATLLASAEIPNTLQAKGCGALSFALDPEFSENHYVYIGRCVDLVTTTLSRYSLEDFADLGATEVEILKATLSRDRDEWHRFGSMGFESDGETLWVLLGDMFYPQYAQDTTKKNGKLLRIVPSREPDEGGYTVARGNAFEPGGEADPDIYAYGIRSPWRGARDKYGRFWIGDVGDVTREEVNLATEPGQNFGWQDHEGPCEENCEGIRDPVLHYGRSEGKAVWVGELYENV